MTMTPGEVERKVHQLDNDVQSIYEMLASISAQQSRHLNRLNALDAKIDVRSEAVEERLAGHDARFDAVESRLGSVEGRLESVEGRLGSVEYQLGSVEGRLESVDTRLGSLDTKLDRVLDRLTD